MTRGSDHVVCKGSLVKTMYTMNIFPNFSHFYISIYIYPTLQTWSSTLVKTNANNLFTVEYIHAFSLFSWPMTSSKPSHWTKIPPSPFDIHCRISCTFRMSWPGDQTSGVQCVRDANLSKLFRSFHNVCLSVNAYLPSTKRVIILDLHIFYRYIFTHFSEDRCTDLVHEMISLAVDLHTLYSLYWRIASAATSQERIQYSFLQNV